MGTVLPFPKPAKGRIRRAQAWGAGGEVALRWMDRSGEPLPANVERAFLPACKIPFDPNNPAHQQAWANMIDLALSGRGQ